MKNDKQLTDSELAQISGGLSGASPSHGPLPKKRPGLGRASDELGDGGDVEVDWQPAPAPTPTPSIGGVSGIL